MYYSDSDGIKGFGMGSGETPDGMPSGTGI